MQYNLIKSFVIISSRQSRDPGFWAYSKYQDYTAPQVDWPIKYENTVIFKDNVTTNNKI